MRLRDLPLLTDENIHPEVSRQLAKLGFDVLTTSAARLNGSTDEAVLRRATAEHRVVVTHDRDFGRLAIAQGAPYRGVVYLRPGHIDPARVVAVMMALAPIELHDAQPFVLVGESRAGVVRIRLRRGVP